ncbi:MAG: bifunctional acetaldehyde-CoA/alcohol dehydrogenase [Candidatus Margulisbacteria bacterium]|jgi:acetaldehyde dehydrogenase/alcohol dehydrogenase|nr:bifunctional acetaldehyde-CoA/alcohol dehydrogenase [Candidatus Margulisiibacteriota bacterium]
MPDKDIKKLDELIQKVSAAQKIYARFEQERVDHIFKAAAMAANDQRIALAKMAVAETGMGIVEDKVIKNHFAAEFIYHKNAALKTCGVIEQDSDSGLIRVADPVGIIAGIVPTTNPTSTAIFKSLLALKTRNAIIFSPHPRAKRSTIEAARIALNAAVKAGAPEGIIGWLEEPTVELSQALMRHPLVNLILATGGPGMVKAAYSSGKPALGVGSGNTPAVIDATADIKTAVSSILLSKSFDNGMICASEQAAVVAAEKYAAVKKEFKLRGGYILNEAEKNKLAKILFVDDRLNSSIVGQPAVKIAAMAGFAVPEETKALIAEVENAGEKEPFAYEKLSPVLALYKAKNFASAVDAAEALVRLGGLGHTAVIYTARKEHISIFARRIPTARILINTPASQGAIGDIYNFKLEPSLTLGCGSWGGNSVSENVGVKHLLNIKTIADRRENMLWFRVPPKIYFKQNALPTALQDIQGRKKAFIVTDKPLFELGVTNKATAILEELKIDYELFYEVKPDPDLTTIRAGLSALNSFKPDTIIALGGGSPIDAAKIMWLLYERPETDFADLALRFMDIRKRIFKFPELGKKAQLIAIPTTSGTGSEVTPFAVVTDDATGVKYPIADYELTPNMAIIDPDFVLTMPPKLAAYSGLDALTHAVESYVSVFATEFTSGYSIEALKLIFKYLPESYSRATFEAREKMHYASCLAGMAFANAFLGVCHSMAHKLGSMFRVPHGLANAILIGDVIAFNATESPRKQAAFAQYKYPVAVERYAELADALMLGGATPAEKTKRLIKAIETLKKQLKIPASLQETGIDEKEFLAKLDVMTEQAFDDQCTSGNPRYPLLEEIREMYKGAYYGRKTRGTR